MEKSWKQMWKNHFRMKYEENAERWKEETHDDRLVFCNIYRMTQEALDSLPDEPHNLVCVAMNRKLQDLQKTLDEIKVVFSGR